MNERIKLLAEQAGMRECSLGYGMPENVLWGENQIENFAELIVRECASICLDMNYTNPQPHHYAVMIKQHFGVEE